MYCVLCTPNTRCCSARKHTPINDLRRPDAGGALATTCEGLSTLLNKPEGKVHLCCHAPRIAWLRGWCRSYCRRCYCRVQGSPCFGHNPVGAMQQADAASALLIEGGVVKCLSATPRSLSAAPKLPRRSWLRTLGTSASGARSVGLLSPGCRDRQARLTLASSGMGAASSSG